MLALVAATSSRCHTPSRDHVEARLDATCRVWERWLGFWAYDGPVGGGGRAQRARAEAPRLRAQRQHRGGADDVAARR